MWTRRRWLGLTLPFALGTGAGASAQSAPFIRFPRDHGSHPDHAIEWWYLTGWLHDEGAAAAPGLGFQLTFFRSRVAATQGMRSRLAARQLLFAHAALTDLPAQRMLTDQRMARLGPAERADLADLDLRMGDWTWRRTPSGNSAPADRFEVRVPGEPLGLNLELQSTQAPLLQGEAGRSRKGPRAEEFSLYYTLPQLEVSGTLRSRGGSRRVTGRAWLDHEWSQQMLPRDAVGWDWIGMNLDDGSALTAFRLRRADGSTLWDGGSLRRHRRGVQVFANGELQFTPQRSWHSPLSQARYPVEWLVRTPAGMFIVRALLDAQEVDSRASTGAWYWEGLSALLDASGQRVGYGYLEMTGYAHQLRLSAMPASPDTPPPAAGHALAPQRLRPLTLT